MIKRWCEDYRYCHQWDDCFGGCYYDCRATKVRHSNPVHHYWVNAKKEIRIIIVVILSVNGGNFGKKNRRNQMNKIDWVFWSAIAAILICFIIAAITGCK